MKNILFFLIACLLLCWIGCNPASFGWKTEKPDEPVAESGDMTEDFDPLTLNDDDMIVEKEPLTVTPARETALPTELVATETETKAQGFRVQLLSVSNPQRAIEEKKKAMMKFNERVYLDFESAMHKLRVGNCKTRDEAEFLRQKAIDLGYQDPWIIENVLIESEGERAEQ